MDEKIGRNDLCPCGSGKKYKHCCWGKNQPQGKKKFSAKVLSSPKQAKPVDLMERTFGSAISKIEKGEQPSKPSTEQNQ